MSDLSLLAAALARVTAADQPNPNQVEPPILAGLSHQTKHQAVQPIALQLHQASIDTYRAEFSRSLPADSTASRSALPIKVIAVNPPAERAPAASVQAQAQQSIDLSTAIPNLLPEPVQLSLRPILTRQGGSISALPPSVRPIALKLHQASLGTYATTLALAPGAGQSAIAQAPKQKPQGRPISQAASSRSSQTNISRAQPGKITLTTTAKLSPAALALGMAQAAGAAQGAADRGWAIPPANNIASRETVIGSGSALDQNQTPAVSQTPAASEKRSAIQAAIALDQKVRAELAKEAAALSSAQSTTKTSSFPQANLSPGLIQAGSNSGNIIQLSPETVARANGDNATSRGVVIEPTVAIAPGNKQAIAAAPSDRRTLLQPDFSPLWQLPQPGAGLQFGPRSGPQLYQQRLAALKQGRLYSRLPIDSFRSIWQGVRHKPSYGQWQRLLAAEARAAGRGQGNNRLSIVLGDSISLWLPMQQLPGSQLWLNQGISGDTTAGILKRLDPLKETSPSNIYVMAGVNDLKNGASDDQVAQNLQQIVRRLRQQHPLAQIHVQSILPASIGLPPGRIQRLNSRIARIAQSERVAFLNLYPQFAASNGQMLAQLTTDGIHLSPQGYALWQSILHRMAEPWAFANQGGALGRS